MELSGLAYLPEPCRPPPAVDQCLLADTHATAVYAKANFWEGGEEECAISIYAYMRQMCAGMFARKLTAALFLLHSHALTKGLSAYLMRSLKFVDNSNIAAGQVQGYNAIALSLSMVS